jgi:UDP-4-amino-4,6-dideoxy-N-acetyl-beta-L-altrosamine N-acetyltransferase
MNSLRDLLPSDREQLLLWRNSPEVARFMYTDHQISREEHQRWFDRIQTDVTCRYWIIECDGVPVGLVNIYGRDERNSRCSWAFYIASSAARGKGVGSFVEYSVLHYVFDELGLYKLCCEVFGFNAAVVRMHEKFGFRKEGLLREHVVKGDRREDVVCLAMTRPEWQRLRPEIEARLQGRQLPEREELS